MLMSAFFFAPPSGGGGSVAPTITGLTYDAPTNEIRLGLTEAANYPVTVYYVVENTATVLTGQAVKDLVIAATPVVFGSTVVSAPEPVSISPNWAGMATGASWYLKVSAQNSTPTIMASGVNYGPFDWDSVAPAIVSSVPADNATAVATGSSIAITFNKNIIFESGLITLRQNIASVWSDLETFDVATEVGAADGQVSISGGVLTINPTATLTASREYAIRIAGTAIANLSGINFAGIANDTTISFTTAAGASWTYDGLKGFGQTFADQLIVALTGVTAGDKLFAVVTTGASTILGVSAGWTLFQRGGAPSGKSGFAPLDNGGTEIYVFTRTADGSETSVTFSDPSFANFGATVLGFEGSGQIGNTWAASAWPFSTSAVANGVTASAGAYVLSVFTSDYDPLTITAPGSVTVINPASPAALGRDRHMVVMEGPLSAGATPNRTATASGASFLNRCTIELEPV